MFKKTLRTVAAVCMIMGVVYYSAPGLRAAVDNTYDQLKLLVDVMTLIGDNYVEERENKKLIVGAINGMVRTLDPFSQFMEPQAYKEMKTETEGQFGGLGIRISVKDEWLTIITPLPGTPAYRIGLLPEDKIIAIEGKSTKNITIEEAVNKLRGEPGTKVTISIAREGEKEALDFTITREIIKIESIYSKMLNSEIGYIRLTEFNANSGRDLDNAVKILEKQGMKSLVFDLRNNPGGLLNIAVDVCKEFIGDGNLIVYTQGRDPKSRRDYYSRNKTPYQNLPMAVLVNRGSASGSEIVAGAMKDLKRALIIGTTTFGKGSVQSIFPLSEGNALRLTTAKYYTPSGVCIHRDAETGIGGVTPDIIIDVSRQTEAKLYIQSEEVFTPGKDLKSPVEDRVEDVVLNRAIEMLKAREIFMNQVKDINQVKE